MNTLWFNAFNHSRSAWINLDNVRFVAGEVIGIGIIYSIIHPTIMTSMMVQRCHSDERSDCDQLLIMIHCSLYEQYEVYSGIAQR